MVVLTLFLDFSFVTLIEHINYLIPDVGIIVFCNVHSSAVIHDGCEKIVSPNCSEISNCLCGGSFRVLPKLNCEVLYLPNDNCTSAQVSWMKE